MAHDDILIDLIKRSIKLKRNQKEKQTVLREFYELSDEYNTLLREFYELADEYNTFVRSMDIKLDRVLSRMEALVEDEC